MKIKEIFVHVSTTNHSEFSLFCAEQIWRKHTNDEKVNCDVKNEDGSSWTRNISWFDSKHLHLWIFAWLSQMR